MNQTHLKTGKSASDKLSCPCLAFCAYPYHTLPPGSRAEGPVGRADQKAWGPPCLWWSVQDCRGPLTEIHKEKLKPTHRVLQNIWSPSSKTACCMSQNHDRKGTCTFSIKFATSAPSGVPPSIYIFQNCLLILSSNLAMIKWGVRPLWPAEARRHRDIKLFEGDPQETPRYLSLEQHA